MGKRGSTGWSHKKTRAHQSSISVNASTSDEDDSLFDEIFDQMEDHTHQTAQEDLLASIIGIPSMDVAQFPRLFRQARLIHDVKVQKELIGACLEKILFGKDKKCIVPHPEQVDALWRLIFGLCDVLLIARTGFGKSLIFRAYTVLTGKTTIQIVPLDRLGHEQLLTVQKIPGTNPVFIHAGLHEKERTVVKLAQGEFTHILIGYEQNSEKSFRDALSALNISQRIGLLAIDECHLIKQWSTFRVKYTMLGQLSSILSRNDFEGLSK